MTKHFSRPQFAPRPTKGQLVKAAKEQVKADEAKAAVPLPPVDESKLPEPTTLAEAVADYQQAKEEFKEILVNDPAAGSEQQDGVPQTPPEQPSAPAAESPTPARPPKGTTDGLYTFGKKYNPKTDRNMATWNALVKALAEGPKTMQQLAEVVKEQKHNDFLGYMTRGGHIVPHTVSG